MDTLYWRHFIGRVYENRSRGMLCRYTLLELLCISSLQGLFYMYGLWELCRSFSVKLLLFWITPWLSSCSIELLYEVALQPYHCSSRVLCWSRSVRATLQPRRGCSTGTALRESLCGSILLGLSCLVLFLELIYGGLSARRLSRSYSVGQFYGTCSTGLLYDHTRALLLCSYPIYIIIILPPLHIPSISSYIQSSYLDDLEWLPRKICG